MTPRKIAATAIAIIAAMQLPLTEFLEQATALWNGYLEVGPGKLDPASDTRLQALARELLESGQLDEPATQAVHAIVDLSARCARSPQGLSFISGEAGLIPRREQHRAFEQALEKARELCGPSGV